MFIVTITVSGSCLTLQSSRWPGCNKGQMVPLAGDDSSAILLFSF